MAKRKFRKLTKASKTLLDNFTDSAKRWGWTEDQGYEVEPERDFKEFETDRAALIKRILQLESQVSDFRKKIALAAKVDK